MSEPSAEQFGGVLAGALAAAALITMFHWPPRGPAAILSGPGGQATCSAAFSPDRAMPVTVAVSTTIP